MLDYTNRAASYDKRWQSYCLASFSRSLDLIHLERDEELLDIACGTGIFLEKVEREHPYVTLTGVDSNQAMLNEAVKKVCLLYTSPSPRDGLLSRMPSSA